GHAAMVAAGAHPAITRSARAQPSYSKPILISTRYSTISPSSTFALDFTTSTVLMLRTVREAVWTAWRAAAAHGFGRVPTLCAARRSGRVLPRLDSWDSAAGRSGGPSPRRTAVRHPRR